MQVDLMTAIDKIMTTFNIQTLLVSPPFEGLEKMDYGLRSALDPVFDWEDYGRVLLKEVPPNTLLFAEDIFDLNYAMFLPPDAEDTLVLVGPWTTGPLPKERLKALENLLGEDAVAAVQEYYNGVRIVPGGQLAANLVALVSLAFPSNEFVCVHRREFLPLNFKTELGAFAEPAFQQDLPAAMLEQRYEAEARILDAVARGDTDAAFAACHLYQRFRIEDRFSSILRNRKNGLIIFNTLLRKAIQSSKVHPYYIDQVSTKFAIRIENMTAEGEQHNIFADMIREYCAYVRHYSLKDYSPLVQKVINHINLNLDTQLSLKALAGMCFISPSYLSNLFKQETGTTLTDYINTQRVERAARRLRTTQLSVAAIAAEVGMMDVNYFTKIFKKVFSTTPTQYRREHAAEG